MRREYGGRAPRPVPAWIKHSGLGFALSLAAGAVALFAYLALTWPDVEALRARDPETTAFIERYLERSAEEGGAGVLWLWVPYVSISIHARRAIVAAEDIGFFWHDGFAYEEIRVAILEALRGERALRGRERAASGLETPRAVFEAAFPTGDGITCRHR